MYHVLEILEATRDILHQLTEMLQVNRRQLGNASAKSRFICHLGEGVV